MYMKSENLHIQKVCVYELKILSNEYMKERLTEEKWKNYYYFIITLCTLHMNIFLNSLTFIYVHVHVHTCRCTFAPYSNVV